MDAQLRRVLGPVDATAVVVGAIVGVGIFFTPSRVAALAGSDGLALAAWALGGGIALLGALTFAELGGLYPRAGAQYDILRDAWGPAVGFLFVVCGATAIGPGATAIIALVCADNAIAAFGGTPGGSGWPAAGLIVAIAGANAVGVRWGATVQNLTVASKVATLLGVGAIGALWAPQALPAATGSALSWPEALAACMVPVLFSYGGWQQALWMAGETRRPERTVPLAILVGVGVVVAVYLLANAAYLALLGQAGVAGSKALAADAVGVALGDAGRRAIGAAVAISALGVLNAQLLAVPRLLFALASDGRFFAPFARIDPRTGTPIAAIALIAALALGLLVAAGASGIDRLLTGIVLVDTVFFALTALASVRVARPDRPFRTPLWPAIPLLFAAAEVGVAVGAWADPAVRSAAWIGLLWIGGAGVLYAVRFRGSGG